MAKGIYIRCGSKKGFVGVEKKIHNQINALSEYFDVSEIVITKENACLLRSILWRMPMASFGRNYEETLNEIDSIIGNECLSFIYVRKPPIDRKFVAFISSLKKRYPSSRIVMEVPTYPYQLELLQSKEMWPWFFKDLYWRQKLSNYIDKVSTFSNDNTLFGIETIRIHNGIDVKSISLREDRSNQGDFCKNTINLLAVAQFQKSHGYERVIYGIHEYYKQNQDYPVILHMVGEGNENKYYRSIVEKLGLEDCVIFYGAKDGEELEDIYSKADIGLSSFGGYKRKLYISSALKVREYLAHGLPVASGMIEDAFNDDTEFLMQYPNDKSTIDIGRIVEFYRLLIQKHGKSELKQVIREYAQNTVDVNITMKPGIEYLISE